MEHGFYHTDKGEEEEEEEPRHHARGEKEEEPLSSREDEDYRMAVLLSQQEEEESGIQSYTTTTTTTSMASSPTGGGGEKRKRPELTAIERDYQERAAGILKRRRTVTFNVPDGQDDDDAPGSTPGHAQLGEFRDRTGRRTSQRSERPMATNHPLNDGRALERDSERLARRVRDSENFTPRDRPTMASSLVVGDSSQTGTSMRGGRPDVHPLVAQVLGQVPPCCQGRGHGHCAEVNTISNHLWMINGSDRWTEQDARSYFEHGGAATAAHRRSIELTDPCPSCIFLTQVLCIATVNATTPDLHQLVQYVVSGVARRYLHCARTEAISDYLWTFEEHSRVEFLNMDNVRTYLQGMDRRELERRIDYDLRSTCPCCAAVIQALLRTRPGG